MKADSLLEMRVFHKIGMDATRGSENEGATGVHPLRQNRIKELTYQLIITMQSFFPIASP